MFGILYLLDEKGLRMEQFKTAKYDELVKEGLRYQLMRNFTVRSNPKLYRMLYDRNGVKVRVGLE